MVPSARHHRSGARASHVMSRDLGSSAWPTIAVLLALAMSLATWKGGVEERSHDFRHFPTSTSSSVESEPSTAADPLAPPKLGERSSRGWLSLLHLPGTERASPVSYGFQVAPGLVDADGDQLLCLGLCCIRARDVSSDERELLQACDVVRTGVEPAE